MNFLRHVGKIGDRKIAIIFREVPNEPHMCLVTYTETLNSHIHDGLMKCIESDIGQNSENLADALNRSYTKDGKIILQVLHAEGLLKKVQTDQVIVTPNPTTKIRLNELNKLLDEMQQGEAAVKRLAEIDTNPNDKLVEAARNIKKQMPKPQTTQPVTAAGNDVLGDSALANNLRQQAQRMHNEAQGLLAESNRLMKEAASLDGSINLETVVKETVTETSVTAKKRGRPAKATTIA